MVVDRGLCWSVFKVRLDTRQRQSVTMPLCEVINFIRMCFVITAACLILDSLVSLAELRADCASVTYITT